MPNIIWPNGLKPDYIDEYVYGLINRISENAKLKELIVTSVFRTASEQARAMYDNLDKGKPAKGGANQMEVTKIYNENKGSNKDEVIKYMTDKINEIGPQNVSRHCGSTRMLITIDFSFNRMPPSARKDFLVAVREIGKYQISAFRHPMPNKEDGETFDPCWHLEILTYFQLLGIDIGEQMKGTLVNP